MILIFCLSNLHVPISLSLINKHNNEQILLYTDQLNIYNVFKQLDLKNVQTYLRKNVYRNDSNIERIKKYFTRCSKQKRSMLNDIMNYKFTIAYFFHNCYGTEELWLLQHIKVDKIYFSPTIKIEGQPCNNIKSYIYKIFVKLLWGVDREAIKYGNIRYIVGKKYIKRNNVEIINHNVFIPEAYTINILRTLDIKQKTILLIEDVISTKNIRQEIYFETIKNIIEILGKENIILKHHPRATWELKNYIKTEFYEMPSYIPVNIVIDKFDIVIGNYSTSIVEVIEKGKRGISLLYLFKDHYISQEMFSAHIKYLNDNDKYQGLKYPKNISELIIDCKNYEH